MTEDERKMIYLDDAINGAISIQRSNGVEIYSDKAVPVEYLINLPSVQPEPLSDAYMKAVWAWLLDYQIKAAELKGKYTPYEVISWVANDWRREHEGSD